MPQPALSLALRLYTSSRPCPRSTSPKRPRVRSPQSTTPDFSKSPCQQPSTWMAEKKRAGSRRRGTSGRRVEVGRLLSCEETRAALLLDAGERREFWTGQVQHTWEGKAGSSRGFDARHQLVRYVEQLAALHSSQPRAKRPTRHRVLEDYRLSGGSRRFMKDTFHARRS